MVVQYNIFDFIDETDELKERLKDVDNNAVFVSELKIKKHKYYEVIHKENEFHILFKSFDELYEFVDKYLLERE